MLRRQHNLGGVEHGALVRVRAAHQVGVHVAARDVVEYEAEVVGSLEGVTQRDDERVLDAREHLRGGGDHARCE